MKSKIIFFNKDYTQLDEIIYKNEDEKTKWRSTYKLSLPYGMSAKIIIECNKIKELTEELTKILKDNTIDQKHITKLRTDMN